jgi:hypothetical protein
MKRILMAGAALLVSAPAFAQSAPVLQGYYVLHGTMQYKVISNSATFTESVVGDVNFRPGGQETSYLSVGTIGTEGQVTNGGFASGSGTYATGPTTFNASFLAPAFQNGPMTVAAAYGVANAAASGWSSIP